MRLSPTTPLVSTIAIAAVAFATSLLCPTAHANLVFNGGFEEGPTVAAGTGVKAGGGAAPNPLEGDLTAIAGPGPYAGAQWVKGTSTLAGTSSVVASNSEAYFDINASGSFAGPRTGALAAVLPSGNGPGNYDGYISQAVLGVLAGQHYNISFWISNQIGDPGNTDNNLTVNWGGTYTDSFNPIAAGVDLNGSGSPVLPNPGVIPVPTGWTQYYFSNVEALTNDARLSFIGGSDNGAILIDDVVVEIVPEISSFGVLMGFGLLALGSVARIRRRTLAVA